MAAFGASERRPPQERSGKRKAGERQPDAPPIDACNALDFFRQRRIQKPTALGQIVERSLQFLHVLARQPARRRRHHARGVGVLIFGTLRSFVAGSPAQRRQTQRACVLGLLSLRDCLILLGRLAGRLRRARLPDILHEAHALLAQQTLDATDGVALAIEEMADAAQKIEVVGAIVAAPAAALHRPDLAEAAFPEPQHVLRNVELLRHFADGPECVRCLVHRRFAPLSRELRYFRASESALMRCLRIADGLNTVTRRGEIGTSLPVFGLRPILWPFLRTTNEPNDDSFTVSPRSRQSVISFKTSSTSVADSVRDNPTFW